MVKDKELVANVEKYRKITNRAKKKKYMIRYGDLGKMKDLELYVFLDAAYGIQDLDRVWCTVGVIIFLNGPRGCAPVLLRTRAIRRIFKPIKTAVTLALEEAMDTAINLARQINHMVTGTKAEKGIPVRVYMDSTLLVDSMESCK